MKKELSLIEKVILVLLATLYPFHPGELLGFSSINFSLGDPVVLISIFLIILGLVGSYQIPKHMLLLFGFISVTILSLTVQYNTQHIDIFEGLFEVIKLIGAVMWSIVIYNIVKKNPIHGIWVFSVFSVAIATFFSALTIYGGLTDAVLRPSGPFQNPNLYGNYLVMNFFLSLIPMYLLSKKINRVRIIPLFLIIFSILIIAIVYTGSRGSLAALVFGLLFMIMLSVVSNSRFSTSFLPTPRYILFILITVIALIWIIWQTNPFVVDRILDTFRGRGRNIDTRITQYLFGLIVFIENPIFGVGYHQAESYVFTNYGLNISEIHNTYIQVAAGTGLIGLYCFFGFLIQTIRDLIRVYIYQSQIAIYILSGIIAMLTQSLFTNGENFRSLWILIGMAAAVSQYYFIESKLSTQSFNESESSNSI